jgi:hypothetical protein
MNYPGEIIKEELWRNIDGNELGDKPHKVADKIMAALNEAGYEVVKRPEPDVGLRGRHEVPGTGIQIQFTDDDFVMWVPNGVDGTTLRKTFDREAGDVLIGALLAARVKE